MALNLTQVQALSTDIWMPDSYDNWSMGNVLMFKLLQGVEKIDSGEYVRFILEYAKARGGAMGEGTIFETAKKKFMNAARYPWAYFYSNFTISIKDETQISGGPNNIDFVLKGLDNAQKTIRDDMGDSLWQSYATSQTQWGGDTEPFWGVEDMMYQTDVSPYFGLIQQADLGTYEREGTATNIWQAYENTDALTVNFATFQILRRNCSVGNEPQGKPDLYVTTPTNWDKFENSLQAAQRHYDPALAQAGFDALKLGSRGSVVADDKCPANAIDAFNFSKVGLKAHKDKFFDGPVWKQPTNQAAKSTQFIFAGGFGTSERRACGRLTAAT